MLAKALVLLLFSVCVAKQPPTAETENGAVVGKLELSWGGNEYQAFLGIPYTKPRFGNDRFKEPEKLTKKWPGTFNATIFGSVCLQSDHFYQIVKEDGTITYEVHGDEDCLFVNVFTKDTGVKNKDVTVFIHGGAFMFGDGSTYKPDYIMDHGDIVFVTFNYRLGPLGFLTTGDSLVPGNNGLKDQVAALQWVQSNIAAFGGDPEKVSIAGLSAGGASVHFHYLSPLSEGLFKRGYSYSGTALCPWATVEDGVEKTQQLAQYLGCPSAPSKALVKCLRKRPARQIVERMADFRKWLYNPFTVFGPVVENSSTNPFIDQAPEDLLRGGKVKDLPWVTGITTSEAIYPVGEFALNDNLRKKLSESWEELAPSLLFYNTKKNPTVAGDSLEKYLGTNKINKDTMPQLIQLLSDRLFVAPAALTAQLQASVNVQPVYLYHFGYRGTFSASSYWTKTEDDIGVSHADDMLYVVPLPGSNSRHTETDKAMGNLLAEIYIQFLSTGNVPETLKWNPVSKDQNLEYLSISSPKKTQMVINPELGNVKFWTNLFEKSKLKDEL